MAKYRRKSAEVEAIQWDGTNPDEVQKFCMAENTAKFVEGEFTVECRGGDVLSLLRGDWIVYVPGNGIDHFQRWSNAAFKETFEPATAE